VVRHIAEFRVVPEVALGTLYFPKWTARAGDAEITSLVGN